VEELETELDQLHLQKLLPPGEVLKINLTGHADAALLIAAMSLRWGYQSIAAQGFSNKNWRICFTQNERRWPIGYILDAPCQ